ncbi:aminopeptidase P family protein [Helicobacter pylori]
MHKKSNPSSFYFVTQESAQYYECSVCCDHAVVLVCEDVKFFITDGRYQTEAQQYCNSQTQVRIAHDLFLELSFILQAQKVKELIFDPLLLSVADYQKLTSMLKEIRFIPQDNFHQELRKVKTPQEIEKIAYSQQLNREAFANFGSFLSENIGKSEKELQFLSKTFLTHQGEFNLSFEPIFALNGNGAKPHALPESQSVLKNGDWILFDAGLKYENYCSDMTRCGYFDKGIDFFSPKIHPLHQRLYNIVLKAKEYAIENLREGMRAKEVDALARGVIEKEGYGKYFVHSTGHGIGLDIHELPRIGPRSEEVISEGMVFSIEPGIYLPDEIGIRLEDLVVIKNGRAQKL